MEARSVLAEISLAIKRPVERRSVLAESAEKELIYAVFADRELITNKLLTNPVLKFAVVPVRVLA